MRSAIQKVCGFSLATLGLTLAVASCGETTSTTSDVAYEDAYGYDYYYPAAVGYAGVAAVGFGYYGIYAATPANFGNGRGGAGGHVGAGGSGGAGGQVAVGGAGGQSAAGGAGGSGSKAPGSTTVRGAVAEAIRDVALGGSVCPGQVTLTRGGGTNVCGLSGSGLNIVFNGCQLSAGGTIDGTVDVQLSLTASDGSCSSSSMVSVGYTSTITNLTYTGNSGAKVVIPNQKDTSTFNVAPGQAPATITMMSSGEIQATGIDGVSTDLTFTGQRTFSSISIANQTYTVDGTMNVTDKAGGTGTMTATGLQQDKSCCKPVGGMLAVSRTGGNHAGSHTWTFSSTCGTATLDGKSVTLPACQ
jgi:hypothetical protein